ncbi:hypothetical protein AKJ16_DCAP19515 [Drosera capensis]
MNFETAKNECPGTPSNTHHQDRSPPIHQPPPRPWTTALTFSSHLNPNPDPTTNLSPINHPTPPPCQSNPNPNGIPSSGHLTRG